MYKLALTTLAALALALGPVAAADTPSKTKKAAETAAEKAKETAEKAVKKATDKKSDAKTDETTESDKALMAHAAKESAKLTAAQKKDLLELVNKGDDKALQTMPGVGETKAAAIKKARPVKSVEDLIMVDGIGEVTFDGIVKWTADGMKADAPAEKADEKKAEEKKPAPKKPATKEKTEDKPTPKKSTKAEDKPAEDKPAKKATKKGE